MLIYYSFWLQLDYAHNTFNQSRPLVRITRQKFFMLQILFVQYRMYKMLFIAIPIFFAHF